jgi:hypothetical protein
MPSLSDLDEKELDSLSSIQLLLRSRIYVLDRQTFSYHARQHSAVLYADATPGPSAVFRRLGGKDVIRIHCVPPP